MVRRLRSRSTAMVLCALGLASVVAAATAPPAAAGVFDDPAFDGDGRLVLQEPALARGVTLQPDGKIVLAGSDASGNFAVWRLRPDGSLDRAFDGDGRAIVDVGGTDFGNAVAIAPDGKIVVAGQVRTGIATDDFALVRLEQDGTLDQTFNPGSARPGIKVLDGDAYERADDVLVQPDGRIVVAGRGAGDYAIARLKRDGDLDGTTFELDAAGGLSSLDALALDGSGRIIAGGSGGIARFLDSGALDDTFAGDGTAAVPTDASTVSDVVVEPDGAVVVAGDSAGADPRMFLARLSAEGRIDTAFGVDGIAAPEFVGAEASAGVARQADGKLVLIGTAGEAGVVMAVARFDARGALDGGYGVDGRLTLSFGFPSAAGGAALQPDGRLVVAGAVDLGAQGPRPAIARLLDAPPAQDPAGDRPGTGGSGPVIPAVARCAGRPATIVGTARSETLRGTAGNDVIVARGGADRVRAGRGHDVVCGGHGRDVLRGGPGADRLSGGAERDRCLGGKGPDRGVSCERTRSLRS